LGRNYPSPHSSGKPASTRELRVQRRPAALGVLRLRPRRSAILIISDYKTGHNRFYERMVPVADDLYDTYIEEIRKEELIP
jgi:hypothetical protein